MHLEKFPAIQEDSHFWRFTQYLVRHEKPFHEQPDFQEKLDKFDNIINNQASLLRKKAETFFNTGGIRQSDRFSARGQGVGVCPGKKAVE